MPVVREVDIHKLSKQHRWIPYEVECEMHWWGPVREVDGRLSNQCRICECIGMLSMNHGLTVQQFWDMLNNFAHTCLCCKRQCLPLDWRNKGWRQIGVDHIIPPAIALRTISRGLQFQRENGLTVDLNNLQPFCRMCNSSKGRWDGSVERRCTCGRLFRIGELDLRPEFNGTIYVPPPAPIPTISGPLFYVPGDEIIQ